METLPYKRGVRQGVVSLLTRLIQKWLAAFYCQFHYLSLPSEKVIKLFYRSHRYFWGHRHLRFQDVRLIKGCNSFAFVPEIHLFPLPRVEYIFIAPYCYASALDLQPFSSLRVVDIAITNQCYSYVLDLCFFSSPRVVDVFIATYCYSYMHPTHSFSHHLGCKLFLQPLIAISMCSTNIEILLLPGSLIFL